MKKLLSVPIYGGVKSFLRPPMVLCLPLFLVEGGEGFMIGVGDDQDVSPPPLLPLLRTGIQYFFFFFKGKEELLGPDELFYNGRARERVKGVTFMARLLPSHPIPSHPSSFSYSSHWFRKKRKKILSFLAWARRIGRKKNLKKILVFHHDEIVSRSIFSWTLISPPSLFGFPNSHFPKFCEKEMKGGGTKYSLFLLQHFFFA